MINDPDNTELERHVFDLNLDDISRDVNQILDDEGSQVLQDFPSDYMANITSEAPANVFRTPSTYSQRSNNGKSGRRADQQSSQVAQHSRIALAQTKNQNCCSCQGSLQLFCDDWV